MPGQFKTFSHNGLCFAIVAEMERSHGQGIEGPGIWILAKVVRYLYRFLHRFMNEIRAGQFDAPGRLRGLRARARLYLNSARGYYSDLGLRLAKSAGKTEKRRVLGVADHCDDCVGQAQLDWVPIDDPSVTGVGVGTVCRSACQCTIEYR